MTPREAAIRARIEAVPALPLVILPERRRAYTLIHMDDRGDGRFVAQVNDQWGRYSDLFAHAPADLTYLLAELATLRAQLADQRRAFVEREAELRAVIANERGQGEPPAPHWRPEFNGETSFWKSPRMIVGLLADGWHWTIRRGRLPCGVAPTAREAMRAADAALTPGRTEP